MKKNRLRVMAAMFALLTLLSGCSSGPAVYVQSVQALSALGGIAPGDRFAGLVVSENVTQIKKDTEKTVKELLVREGDDVDEGQELFSYDTEELQLSLDKQKLELEQLKASIESFKVKIAALEKERSSVKEASRLQYTLEIQTAQLDMKEAEMKLKAKENEITRSQELLDNAVVVSPIRGRIQSINESGTSQNGEPAAYITIQQIGSYRIKGIIGELQRGGIVEGDRIRILSRTDETASWAGTVTLVDYENPSQGNENDRYYGMMADEMTAASKYPFYVELDSTDGLMLGQHVYLELMQEEDAPAGIGISSAFICYDEDGTAYVWAEKNSRLEKRTVTLGEYNPMTDMQEITEGITMEDYLAFPDAELCQEGAATTREEPVAVETGEGEVA